MPVHTVLGQEGVYRRKQNGSMLLVAAWRDNYTRGVMKLTLVMPTMIIVTGQPRLGRMPRTRTTSTTLQGTSGNGSTIGTIRSIITGLPSSTRLGHRTGPLASSVVGPGYSFRSFAALHIVSVKA